MTNKIPALDCARWPGYLLGLTCLCSHLSPAQCAERTNRAPIAVWDASARVTAGFGYRENVLRSSIASENSGFFLSSADATFIRLSETGALLALYLLGEDTRYFNAPSVGYEQLFSGTVQGALPVSERNELGGQVNYLYQHQILDVSETEAILRRVLVDGHAITVRPHWKYTLGAGWALKLEGQALRQIYEADLDDFWEGGGRLSLIRAYGNRSEASVGYQSRHRFYDTREQFDEYGVIIPGTSLVYWQQEVGGQWRHYWDKARRWRTTSKLGYMFNRDNGSGYFDYERILFKQQLRWANGVWEVKVNARFGWYFYQTQAVGDEPRERSYVALDARVERRLGKHWLLYAAGEREWNMSNDRLDDYDDWMASGGVGVEF